MKRIEFSQHALDQLADRGTTRKEVEETIRSGERLIAKRGRYGYRKNFLYDQNWKGKLYPTKQVLAIAAEEPVRLVVITVYVFFFGGD